MWKIPIKCKHKAEWNDEVNVGFESRIQERHGYIEENLSWNKDGIGKINNLSRKIEEKPYE